MSTCNQTFCNSAFIRNSFIHPKVEQNLTQQHCPYRFCRTRSLSPDASALIYGFGTMVLRDGIGCKVSASLLYGLQAIFDRGLGVEWLTV